MEHTERVLHDRCLTLYMIMSNQGSISYAGAMLLFQSPSLQRNSMHYVANYKLFQGLGSELSMQYQLIQDASSRSSFGSEKVFLVVGLFYHETKIGPIC